MDKMSSWRVASLILAVIAAVLLVAGIYGMTRPMSYGSEYYHASFYEGEDFNGSMVFYADNTMVIRNTNLDEEYKSYHYYKDGYIFFTLAQTEKEYREEVAAIEADFEGAVDAPFYASRINVFRLSSVGPDGFRSVYACQVSIMMLVIWGAVELALIGSAISLATRSKKQNMKNK